MVEETKTNKNFAEIVGDGSKFKVEPKDVLNTKIRDLLGNRFIMKRG